MLDDMSISKSNRNPTSKAPMKTPMTITNLLLIPSLLFLAAIQAAAQVRFTFEEADGGPVFDIAYGSLDPQGFTYLLRNGFIVDVACTGFPNPSLHLHETDSIP